MIKRIIIFCFIFLSVSSGILAQPISFLPNDPILEEEVVRKRGEEGKRLLDTTWKFYGERKYDKAIEYGMKILAINPNDYEANSIIGGNYAKKGDFKKAIAYFQKATNVYPMAMIPIMMGISFSPIEEGLGIYTHEDYAKANENYNKRFYKVIEDYKNDIVRNPDDYQTYNDLGYFCFILKDELRTENILEEYFKKSIEIKPDYAQAHYNLAFYYLCDVDKNLALEECKILERLNKDLARVILRTIELSEKNKVK